MLSHVLSELMFVEAISKQEWDRWVGAAIETQPSKYHQNPDQRYSRFGY